MCCGTCAMWSGQCLTSTASQGFSWSRTKKRPTDIGCVRSARARRLNRRMAPRSFGAWPTTFYSTPRSPRSIPCWILLTNHSAPNVLSLSPAKLTAPTYRQISLLTTLPPILGWLRKRQTSMLSCRKRLSQTNHRQRPRVKWKRRLPTESNIWRLLITNINKPFRSSGTLKKRKSQKALFYETLSKPRLREPERHNVTAHGTRECKWGTAQGKQMKVYVSTTYGLRMRVEIRP